MISFIVPAHNEEQLLGATLHALHLAAQVLEDGYEIVVVDDASTDRTAEIAEHYAARVVTVAHRHIAATRNAGARAAVGDLFIFVDADTLVSEAVVRAAIDAIRGGAIGGGVAVHFQEPVAAHERLGIAFFEWLFRATRIAPGCCIFCTRAAFEAVGGFDETYYAAEDIVMSRALAKYGRFVILRQAVRTSARKLRTLSGAAEHLRLAALFAWRGTRMLKTRDALDLWYGERRVDLD